MASTSTLDDLLFPTQQTEETTLAPEPVLLNAASLRAATQVREPSPAAFPAPAVAPTRATGPRGLDRETGGQFTLGQNVPNPYVDETTVPFTLTNGGDVRLDIFDLAGRKVAGIARKALGAGPHTICLNLGGLGLPVGHYSYQLQVTNSFGVYRQSKMMTAA